MLAHCKQMLEQNDGTLTHILYTVSGFIHRIWDMSGFLVTSLELIQLDYANTFESLFRTEISAKTMKLTKSTFPMLSGLLR